MKVLFMTNIPSPYRVEFFKELAEYCDLTVTYEKDNATDRENSWLQIEDSKKYRQVFLKQVFSQSASAFCPEIKKYLKRESYDFFIVGTYSTPTGMYAVRYLQKKKLPYVINCDGGIKSTEPYLKWKFKHTLLSKAEAWLSTGKISDEYLINYGADESRIYHYPFTSIHDGDVLTSPITLLEKKELKEKLGIKENQMVLSVGQFIYRKGYDILLEATKNMSHTIGFYVIGGTITKEYADVIAENNLTNVHFLPFKNKQELSEYYQAADLFVLPTREDIWGLVINEAVAYGLPVITTNQCVAGQEMLASSGTLIPAEDSHRLKDEIENALKEINEEKYLENQHKSLEIARAYTIEKMAERHDTIFHEILESRGKRVLFCGTNVSEEIEHNNDMISSAGNRFQNNLISNIEYLHYKVTNLHFIATPLMEEDKEILLQEEKYTVKTTNTVAAVRSYLKKVNIELRQTDIVMCYNVIYAWLSLGNMARRKKKRSIAVLADYSAVESYQNWKYKLYAKLQLYGMRRFDVVVGLSDKIEQKLRKNQKFILMEGGISREFYNLFANKQKAQSEVVTFMFSGLLNQVTGIMILIWAFQKIDNPKARLIITGKGDLSDEIKKIASKTDNIDFLGNLPYEDYIKTLSTADILVNPRDMGLPENQNNFPSKIMDYLATGKPILSTKFSGWERFQDYGVFCDSTIEQLQKTMEILLDDYFQEEKQVNGKAVDQIYQDNRAFAEKFLWEQQVKRILEE